MEFEVLTVRLFIKTLLEPFQKIFINIDLKHLFGNYSGKIDWQHEK